MLQTFLLGEQICCPLFPSPGIRGPSPGHIPSNSLCLKMFFSLRAHAQELESYHNKSKSQDREVVFQSKEENGHWGKTKLPTTSWSSEQPVDLASLDPPSEGAWNQGAVSQCHCCGLHHLSVGHQELCCLKVSKSDNLMEGNFPGVDNWKVDLSHLQLLGSREICLLSRYLFSLICQKWESPDVETLASRFNNTLPLFP